MRQDRRPRLNHVTKGKKVEVEGPGRVPALPSPAESRFDGVEAGQHL